MKSEADLAKLVIAALEQQGWMIYQEVDALAGRADIVATKGSLVHVVECKLVFGFEVIEQARRWLRHANLVSIATLRRKTATKLAEEVCAWVGVGWLTEPSWDEFDSARDYRQGIKRPAIVERVTPRLWRGHGAKLRARLRPEHQTMGIAGSNGGGYFTAWKATAARLADAARTHPGRSVRDLVRMIDHHYAHEKSAAGCLTRDIEAGRIPAITLGVDRRVYPADPGADLSGRLVIQGLR